MQSSGKPLSSPIKLYVMAENRLLREALVRAFRKRSEIRVVGDTCGSDAAIETLVSAQSDVLVLDCFETRYISDEWLAQLEQSLPDIKIVLFGMSDDPDLFLRAVRCGIAGYVLKSASAADLLEAIRTVAQGEAACPPKFCKVLFKAVAAIIEAKDERATTQVDLTRRQRQLMSLVAMGLSNKEIASNLNLSEFTVKNHIYRVMKQLDVQNRHDAASLVRDAN